MKDELSKRQTVEKDAVALEESDFEMEDARWKPR